MSIKLHSLVSIKQDIIVNGHKIKKDTTGTVVDIYLGGKAPPKK